MLLKSSLLALKARKINFDKPNMGGMLHNRLCIYEDITAILKYHLVSRNAIANCGGQNLQMSHGKCLANFNVTTILGVFPFHYQKFHFILLVY